MNNLIRCALSAHAIFRWRLPKYLAQGFIDGDADRGRQVEAPNVAGDHGDFKGVSTVLGQKMFGEATGFRPENKAVSRTVLKIGVDAFGPRAEINQAGPMEPGFQFVEIRFPAEIDKRPVIEPGTLDGTFVGPESGTADDMQGDGVGGAETRNISCIRVNLRIH